MSRAKIRAALEGALNSMSPALATAWDNAPFTPVVGTPYQEAHLLFAKPVNREVGASYTEQGFLQASLKYPLNTGSAAAEARGELLRSTFPRGASFTASGVTTHIEGTPDIRAGRADGDRWVVPVVIPFYAHVRN